MVLLARSIPRLARPAFSKAFSTARSLPSIAVRGAAALRQKPFGTLPATSVFSRGYADKREKVKVLLVLYDGKISNSAKVNSELMADQLNRWKARRGG